MSKWDARFLELAAHIAKWSKDPSTCCGSVIVRHDRGIASVGYNGFARGCDDSDHLYNDREVKYKRVIHCEMNAILSAREPLHGYTLYVWPFLTCDRCAMHVIQAGIKRVVAPICPPDKAARWEETFRTARQAYMEAGVLCEEIEHASGSALCSDGSS
jgi:dCMP deaminase